MLKNTRSKNDHRKIDPVDLNSLRREPSNGGLGIVVAPLVCSGIDFCVFILGVQSSCRAFTLLFMRRLPVECCSLLRGFHHYFFNVYFNLNESHHSLFACLFVLISMSMIKVGLNKHFRSTTIIRVKVWS